MSVCRSSHININGTDKLVAINQLVRAISLCLNLIAGSRLLYFTGQVYNMVVVK